MNRTLIQLYPFSGVANTGSKTLVCNTFHTHGGDRAEIAALSGSASRL